MGVPPQKLAPFDAIMHTSQLEDGQKVAKMACDFIEARYPDAADGSVETAIVITSYSIHYTKLYDSASTSANWPGDTTTPGRVIRV